MDPDARRSPLDLAASMALLRELVRDDAAQEYAEASIRHRSTPTSAGTRVVFVLCLVIVAVVLSVAVMQRRAAAPETERVQQQLVERARSLQSDVEALEADVARQRAELAAQQQSLLSQTSAGEQLAARLALMGEAAGYSAVSGPGFVVTLDDSLGADPASADDPGRVLDRDVQAAVNGLWEAGAEAVAVNGQRLTSVSAIRSAGSAVLVDFHALQPPYRIEAIGDPASLERGFAASESARDLAAIVDRYGVRLSTETAEALTLPAATSLLPVRARVDGVDGATLGTTSGGAS